MPCARPWRRPILSADTTLLAGAPLALPSGGAEFLRREIDASGGNEVCVAADVADDGTLTDLRVVARGSPAEVLAVVGSARGRGVVLHNHPSGDLNPSSADLAVAARLWEEGWGFAIVDNAAERMYVVVEPPEVSAAEPIDLTALSAALDPSGPFASVHPDYEDRPGQRDMARAVAEAYNDGGLAVIEAGTGTGKSVAYLLPALAWADRNGERTVVSTNTINLQEQLFRNDIPLVSRLLGRPVRAVLVKGRANYVSIRRARLAASTSGDLFGDGKSDELGAIMEWLDTTNDGSLSDLPFRPSAETWEEVASDADACLGVRCPHFSDCHYQRARRDAASAELLIVNHHLLFSDLGVRRARGSFDAPAVLPRFSRLVLDEAHNLEEVATDHLGSSVSRIGLVRLLRRADRKSRGIVGAVAAALRKAEWAGLATELDDIEADRARPAIRGAERRAAEVFDRLETLREREGAPLLRLGPDFASDPVWEQGLREALDGFLAELRDLVRALDAARERVLGNDAAREAVEGLLVEMRAVRNRLAGAGVALNEGLQPAAEDNPLVRWIERRRVGEDSFDLRISAAPLDLTALMRETVFEPVETVVMTSATLATRGDFAFVRDRLGISGTEQRPLRELIIPSPFDFANQTRLLVPRDLARPGGRSSPAHDRDTARVVEDVAGAADGGVFALFTSYSALRTVAESLRGRRIEARWPILVHGEESRGRLLDRFIESGRAILLGTSSFWEGVDVPGDPLRALVIPRLPFRVPTDPVTAARVEAIEARGGNAFAEYTLPHAAIRLKQGVGRLVRSSSDRGVIVLLDGRVVDRGYGRYILDSLPPAPLRTGAWGELLPEIGPFLARP